MTVNEQTLIERTLNGDDAAFRQIIQLHEKMLHLTVTGMLGDVPEVKDVVQQVFIRFFNSINKFKGESSIGTYLTRIAINLSLNEIKRRKNNRMKLSAYTKSFQSSTLSTKSGQESLELNDAIGKALLLISEEMRSVVVLRLVKGFSTKETAEILNLPMGTIASRLARSQEKLKEILKEYI